jgi:hypothetical protein
LLYWYFAGRGCRPVTGAGVAELVDAPDLGSGIVRCGGSSPFARTSFAQGHHEIDNIFLTGNMVYIFAKNLEEVSYAVRRDKK